MVFPPSLLLNEFPAPNLLSEQEESPKKKLKLSPTDSIPSPPPSKEEISKTPVKTPSKSKEKPKAKKKSKKTEETEVVEDKEIPSSFIHLQKEPEQFETFSKLLETESFVIACVYSDGKYEFELFLIDLGSTNYRQVVQSKRKKKNSMMHDHVITGFAIFFIQSNKHFFVPFELDVKNLMSSTVPSICFNCQGKMISISKFSLLKELLRGVVKTAKWKSEDIRDLWIVDNCFGLDSSSKFLSILDPLVASFMLNPGMQEKKFW